jgi:hypothetical protein
VAEPSSKDPAAAWQDLVAQWEKNLNALANRTTGSDEFSKSINQAVRPVGRHAELVGRAHGPLSHASIPTRHGGSF